MRDDNKKSGISLFGQSEGLDPIEEMFALNLGDFISENLISEELAKKVSVSANKKERLKNQLMELIDIYSSKNTLSILNFDSDAQQAIYSSIAKSIVKMIEVDECAIYLIQDDVLKIAGQSKNGEVSVPDISFADLIYEDVTEKDGRLFISMKSSAMPVGMIEIVSQVKLKDDYMELILSVANLLATTINLQFEADFTNNLLNTQEASESELKQARAELTSLIGDLCDYQQAFVEALAVAVDKKGHYTVSHSKNTAKLSRAICKILGLNEKTTDLIYYAGLLQNIGKITLPEKLFAKDGKLAPEELSNIKNHTNVGVNLLMSINFLSEVVPYITYHTERVDGSGTPEGLKGQSIPLGSRIIAVADVYCAMTSDRPYRKAMSPDEAIEIIKSEAGTKWDSDVVNALLQAAKTF